MMRGKHGEHWRTQPISSTCEVRVGSGVCGKTTASAYPAHGGGWMALCVDCGLKHTDIATPISKLVADGERLV